jgi:hypothetical protein
VEIGLLKEDGIMAETGSKNQAAQNIKNRLPSASIALKLLSGAPSKAETAQWNPGTIGLDEAGNKMYIRGKRKTFIIPNLTEY